MELGISVTPKVHIVIFHTIDFCKISGRGISPCSEKTKESVQQDFRETWKRYKVNDDHEI